MNTYYFLFKLGYFIGSRDRSVSVWLTSLKRPLFVCHDLFESSILDLAWSKVSFFLILLIVLLSNFDPINLYFCFEESLRLLPRGMDTQDLDFVGS